MSAGLLVTGAGTAAAANLIRSLRAGDRTLRIVGCHSDRLVLRKSTADRHYLVPTLGDRGFLGAVRRVVVREKIDLLIPTTDAEVAAVARARARLPCAVFLPRTRVIDLCQDKYRLSRFLRARGVPAPLTFAVTGLGAVGRIFARLPRRSLVWCRVRAGSGSTAAIPVRRPEQAQSWIAYWREMRGVPVTSFTLSEYLPGRDYSCQSLWKDGALILIKTCERLSYFGGGAQPGGTSSVSHLAKTVHEPRVAEVSARAIRAIDRAASGTFNVDLRENSAKVPCVTEINAGRFPSGVSIFDLSGKHNLSSLYVRVALGEPVGLQDEYESAEGFYTIRDLDTPTGVFHADDFFDRIEDVRR